MNGLILGIDAGNYEGKTVGQYGVDVWHTNISGLVERKVSETYADDDMEFVVNGREGLAGTIAKYETRRKSKGMYGATKAHWYTEVRVLLSIYRYAIKFGVKTDNVKIVTGQPYTGHTNEEKALLKKLLQRTHELTVNGNRMSINIEEVGIAPEGVGAFFSQPFMSGKLLDIGSGTVNAISFEDYRVTNYNSDTFNYGTEVECVSEVVAGAIQDTTSLGWTTQDAVYVCGGSAYEVLPEIKRHYVKAELLSPTFNDIRLSPKFANAVGFYELAAGTFR